MVDGPFQSRPKLVQSAIEIIERQETQNRNAQAARRGDQGFGNAAADLRGRQLVATDKLKRMHDTRHGAQQAQQRCQCDERAQDPLTALASIQLIRGVQLHRPQQ